MPQASRQFTTRKSSELSAALPPEITPIIPAGEDVDLILWSNRLVEIQARTFELESDPDALMNHDAELIDLDAEWHRVIARMEGLTPTTLKGAQALARAAIACSDIDTDGRVIAQDPGPRMMNQVAGFLAGDFVLWVDSHVVVNGMASARELGRAEFIGSAYYQEMISWSRD